MNTKQYQLLKSLIGKKITDITLDCDACFRLTVDKITVAITEKYSSLNVCITEPPKKFEVSYILAGQKATVIFDTDEEAEEFRQQIVALMEDPNTITKSIVD